MLSSIGSDSITLLSIDPGINHLGLCIARLKLPDYKFISSEAITFHAKEKYLNKETVEKFSMSQAKIDYMSQNVLSVLYKEKPVTVIAESPFYNHLRPAAFMPLVELLYQLKQVVRVFHNVNFVTYPPSIIKKAVGASAICKKDEVKIYVNKLKEKMRLSSDWNALDEHSIDALAAMYTHVQKAFK